MEGGQGKKIMLKFMLTILGVLCVMTTTAHAFTLSSTAFSNLGTIPIKYTCDGNDISPPLSWKQAPAATKSFALILSDPDAPGGTFYHWVLFNIPASMNSLPEGLSNEKITVGKTSWGKSQYNGPCPPKGSPHHYIFTLYALDTPQLTLAQSTDAEALLRNINKHILAQTELTGLYARK